MKITPVVPPREFAVGEGRHVVLKDCARLELEPDEQVTFVTPSGAEYDIARKTWGFYATPSLNGRLARFGWRSALVRSPAAKYYIFLVEDGHDADLRRYLAEEGLAVVCWLDRDADLDRLERGLGVFRGQGA